MRFYKPSEQLLSRCLFLRHVILFSLMCGVLYGEEASFEAAEARAGTLSNQQASGRFSTSTAGQVDTGSGQGVYANSISQGYTQSAINNSRSNVLGINDDSGSRGYEKKAELSTDTGIQAGNAAAAAGATMLGIGIPLFLSPEIISKVIGADLIMKGIQELATASSQNQAAQRNNELERLLTNTRLSENGLSNQNGDGFATPNLAEWNRPIQPNASQIVTPELDAVLARAGINPDNFKNDIISGNISTPEQAARGLGETSNISPTTAANAFEASSQLLGRILNDESKLNSNSNVANAGSATGSSSALSKTDGGKPVAVTGELGKASADGLPLGRGTSSDKEKTEGASHEKSDRPIALLIQKNGRGSHQGSSVNGGNDDDKKPGESGDINSLLGGILGGGGASALASSKNRELNLIELSQLGIVSSKSKMNVFQLAGRRFGGFGQYRKEIWKIKKPAGRVAQQ